MVVLDTISTSQRTLTANKKSSDAPETPSNTANTTLATHHQYQQQQQQQQPQKQHQQQQHKQQQQQQKQLQKQNNQENKQSCNQLHNENRKTENHQLKKLYVGNFSTCVTADDIYELFGLRSTNYLCDNCSVEMPLRSHNQSKRFAFITASHHVTKELVKLNGVQFQGNCLIVEEARSTRKYGLRFNPYSRPRVYNNFLEDENTCQINNLVPGHITYAETAKSAKRSITGHMQNCIVIFGDSITRRIRVRDFNRELNTGHARIRTFPGAVSKENPHYITPTLEDGNFDTAILHFGVNDLLRN